MTGNEVLDTTVSATGTGQPPEAPPSPPQKRKPPRILAFAIMLAIAGAALAWVKPSTTLSQLFHGNSGAVRTIALSGRIEGDDSAVAPKTSGRILEVRVREGDNVSGGQILAVLDDQQVRAREERARVGVEGAEPRAKAAKTQIDVLEEQLRQSQLQGSGRR